MHSADYRLTIVESKSGNLQFICEACKSYYVFANRRNLFYSSFGNFVFTVGEPDGWWQADNMRKERLFKDLESCHGMIVPFDPAFLICPCCKNHVPTSAYSGLKKVALLYHVMFDNEKEFESWRIIMPPNYANRVK